MVLKGRIVGCSHGGFWYEPPGYFCDYAINSARREWFKTREQAEEYVEGLRDTYRKNIRELQMKLDAI